MYCCGVKLRKKGIVQKYLKKEIFKKIKRGTAFAQSQNCFCLAGKRTRDLMFLRQTR
jgi:hypothetical protein